MSKNNSSQKWAAPFFTIWTGQAFSLLGSQLVQFALIWWLTKTTGSATVLATASLVGLLPQVLLGPVVGALVDRWNRRLTMIAADSLVALSTLVLALLFWAGLAQIWHVYALMFLRAVAGTFHWTSMQASTTLMVPKEHLARLQGLNQVLNGGMNIASAPLGALLLEWLPMQGVLAVDIGTAFLAVLPLLFISVPQPERSTAPGEQAQKTSVWQDFRAGLHYVWTWPGLMMILVMATVINLLLNPAFALLPLLVRLHFGGEALQLATLESTMGIGVLAGGLLLSAWGGFRRKIYTSMAGLICIGLSSLVIGQLPASAFSVAVIVMFFMGFANPITNGPLFAVVQSVVAPEMQGRVFTLIMSLAGAASPLGLIVAGPLADRWGPQAWFVIGGIVTGLMGISGAFIPAIKTLEDGRPVKESAPISTPAARGAEIAGD